MRRWGCTAATAAPDDLQWQNRTWSLPGRESRGRPSPSWQPSGGQVWSFKINNGRGGDEDVAEEEEEKGKAKEDVVPEASAIFGGSAVAARLLDDARGFGA